MVLAPLTQQMRLLPGRFGARPRTSAGLPFRQLDQLPPAGMPERLLRRCLDFPGVRCRDSRMAAPGTKALWVPDGAAAGPASAFIDGNEFCHLHLAAAGCLHLTLPAAAVEGIVARGWAERHPIHQVGLMNCLVLVYAPRDAMELEAVLSLVEQSWRFASGQSAAGAAAGTL